MNCFVRARVTGEVVCVIIPAEAESARERSKAMARRGPGTMLIVSVCGGGQGAVTTVW